MGDLDIIEDLAFDFAVIAKQITSWHRTHHKNSPSNAWLTSAITDVHLEDTVEGASTLEITVADETFELIEFFDVNENGRLEGVDLNYPLGSSHWWRLTQLRVSDNAQDPVTFVLVFMEQGAVLLMHHYGPKKASRGRVTRAEFFKSLVDKVKYNGGLNFVSKELHKEQPTVIGEVAPRTSSSQSTVQAINSDAILHIGDSLAVGTHPVLVDLYGANMTYSAHEGDNSTVGLEVLKRKLKPRHNVVIFDYGTNDGGTTVLTANLKEVKRICGSRRVYVPTINTGASDSFTANMNQVIRRSGMHVIDWKKFADDNHLANTPNVHPDANGYSRRAHLFRQNIGNPSGGGRTPSNQVDDATRQMNKDPGLHVHEDVTIKGVKIDPKQVAQVNRALDVARRLHAGEKAMIALIMCGIEESSFRPVMNGEGSSYGGVFQGNVRSGLWDINDTEGMAKCFLKGGKGFQGGGAMALIAEHKDWPLGQVVLTVQGSIANFGGNLSKGIAFYSAHESEAEAIYQAYGGSSVGSGTTYYRPNYHFKIGTEQTPHESYWDGMTRLAQDVNWRLFIDGKTVYFDSDMTLIKQMPVAMIDRDSPTILSYDGTIDVREICTEMTMEIICEPFAFRAGQVVKLRGFGPISKASSARKPKRPGYWLITNISRDSGAIFSTFTLNQPEKPLKEPVEDLKEREAADVFVGGGAGAGLEAVKNEMTPKEVMDQIVIPVAKQFGMKTPQGLPISPANVAKANAAHNYLTTSGNVSDHSGPPTRAWAADITNGTSPTKEMDNLRATLADMFGVGPMEKPKATGGYIAGNAVSASHKGFRFQIIYRTTLGGNHYNHVHFGIRKEAWQGPT